MICWAAIQVGQMNRLNLNRRVRLSPANFIKPELHREILHLRTLQHSTSNHRSSAVRQLQIFSSNEIARVSILRDKERNVSHCPSEQCVCVVLSRNSKASSNLSISSCSALPSSRFAIPSSIPANRSSNSCCATRTASGS